MSKVAELTEVLKTLAAKRQKQETQKTEEVKEVTKVANPNSERFAALQDAALDGSQEAVAELGCDPLPAEWQRLEKQFGQGTLYGRIVRATAYAKKFDKSESQDAAIKVIQDRFRDPDTAKWLYAQLQKSLQSGVPSDGGYVVPQAVQMQIDEMRRARSVMTRLGITEIDLPYGNLSWNKQTQGAEAHYVGELEGAEVSEPKFGDINLVAHKLMTFVRLSNDLIKSTDYRMDQFVRRDCERAANDRRERAFWAKQLVPKAPRGLGCIQGVSQISLGVELDPDNAVDFLVALLSSLVDLDDAGSYNWAFAQQVWRDLYNVKATTGQYILRDEMSEGRLLNYPFYRTQFLRPNDTPGEQDFPVYFGDWSEVLFGVQGAQEIDTSSEASIPVPGGGQFRSFHQDGVIVRLIERHDWTLRRLDGLVRCLDIKSDNTR